MPARLLLLFAVAIWGFSSPIAKFALGFLPPQLLLTYRFGLIVILLSIPIYFSGRSLKKIIAKYGVKDKLMLFLLGFFGTFGQIGLIYLGFNYTTASEGTLLIATAPIFVAVFGLIFLRQRFNRYEIIGYMFGFLGTLLLITEPTLNLKLGNLFILAANCCWASFIVLIKKFDHKSLPPIFLTWWMFLVGFVGMLLVSLFSVPLPLIFRQFINLPLPAHLAVGYLAVAAGIIAYLFYQTALKTIPVAESELYEYLSPLFATPLAVVWLGESVTPHFLISASLIATGLILAEVLPHFHQKSSSHRLLRSNRRR